VVVTVAAKTLSGPALTVQVDAGPGPGPGPGPAKATVYGEATGAGAASLKENQEYAIVGVADCRVNFSQIVSGGGPAPGQLTVVGYQPAAVKEGQSFVILGSGFSRPGSLSAVWGTMPLAITPVNDTQIAATAPAGASGSFPVSVTLAGQVATGPALTVTSQGGGGGGGGGDESIRVLVTAKPRAYGNTLAVQAYTSDLSGGSLPASVNGRVTGPGGAVDLWGQTTHGTQSPATWQISRPAPWGTPCDVVVHAFTGGQAGTGRAQG
jgi:hypothetical protein